MLEAAEPVPGVIGTAGLRIARSILANRPAPIRNDEIGERALRSIQVAHDQVVGILGVGHTTLVHCVAAAVYRRPPIRSEADAADSQSAQQTGPLAAHTRLPAGTQFMPQCGKAEIMGIDLHRLVRPVRHLALDRVAADGGVEAGPDQMDVLRVLKYKPGGFNLQDAGGCLLCIAGGKQGRVGAILQKRDDFGRIVVPGIAFGSGAAGIGRKQAGVRQP